jgi:hypothetical protein
VESPGTAPGSEPRITGAFIAIVPVARNKANIGAGWMRCKRFGGPTWCMFPVHLAYAIRTYDLRRCFCRILRETVGGQMEKARAEWLRGP